MKRTKLWAVPILLLLVVILVFAAGSPPDFDSNDNGATNGTASAVQQTPDTFINHTNDGNGTSRTDYCGDQTGPIIIEINFSTNQKFNETTLSLDESTTDFVNRLYIEYWDGGWNNATGDLAGNWSAAPSLNKCVNATTHFKTPFVSDRWRAVLTGGNGTETPIFCLAGEQELNLCEWALWNTTKLAGNEVTASIVPDFITSIKEVFKNNINLTISGATKAYSALANLKYNGTLLIPTRTLTGNTTTFNVTLTSSSVVTNNVSVGMFWNYTLWSDLSSFVFDNSASSYLPSGQNWSDNNSGSYTNVSTKTLFYVNYSKNASFIPNSLWQVNTSLVSVFNTTIDSECFNGFDNLLVLRLEILGGSVKEVNTSCHNGSVFNQLYTSGFFVGGEAVVRFYDESIFWNVGLPSSNQTINLTQTIWNVNVSECDSANHSNPIMNFSYFDEVNNSPVTADVGYNLDFFDGFQTSNLLRNLSNIESNKFCTNLPNATFPTNWNVFGDFTVTANNYIPRLFTIPSSNPILASNKPTQFHDWYLIRTTNSTTVTYIWKTAELSGIDGTMQIFRCNLDGTRDLIESVPIVSGVAVANIQLLFQPYSYQVIIDGVTYTDPSFTTCHVESSNEVEFIVDVSGIDNAPVFGLFFVGCLLEKVSDNVVRMTWHDNSESSDNVTGCIIAHRESSIGRQKIYENCSFGKVNSITRTIPDNGFAYTVEGTVTQDGVTAPCQNSVSFFTLTDVASLMGLTGIFAVAFMVVSMILFFAGDGEATLVGGGIGLVIAWVLGIFAFPWPIVSAMIAFLAVIGIIGRYSRA